MQGGSLADFRWKFRLLIGSGKKTKKCQKWFSGDSPGSEMMANVNQIGHRAHGVYARSSPPRQQTETTSLHPVSNFFTLSRPAHPWRKVDVSATDRRIATPVLHPSRNAVPKVIIWVRSPQSIHHHLQKLTLGHVSRELCLKFSQEHQQRLKAKKPLPMIHVVPGCEIPSTLLTRVRNSQHAANHPLAPKGKLEETLSTTRKRTESKRATMFP